MSDTTAAVAPTADPKDGPAEISNAWVWKVCGVLLLASSINYMDRQTLSSISVRITDEFQLSNEQYASLEAGFGYAFAIGALFFGAVADRVNIRWLYPVAVLAWSAMGVLTGLAQTFAMLFVCRTLLGMFEAGHWPCALKTTQRLLPPSKRTLGNSVLQSGTAIGAIATPLILNQMLTDAPGSWRPAFQAIGLTGVVWAILWLSLVRSRDLAPLPQHAAGMTFRDFLTAIFSRRFLTLVAAVCLINTCYHIFRVWMPRFLQNERGYLESTMLNFQSCYYIANDIGCLGAGFLTVWMHEQGWSVHWSRLSVFAFCGVLTGLSLLIPFLPAGPLLLGVLLLISMGSLGMFPCYYSFSQELSQQHQGKVTGLLGAFAWFFVSSLHKPLGRFIDQTGHTDWGLALAGLVPLLAAAIILIGWGPDKHPAESVPT